MRDLERALRVAISKTGPEIRALLTGNMPAFVTARPAASAGAVPVFVFHAVEPQRFEAQLRYLAANGYRTLDADELEAARGSRRDDPAGREVALTFDDATWTFWSYAFPLLRSYGARAILFAIPGLVPDDATVYPNLDDVLAGRCTRADVAARGGVQPLCTWRELMVLHRSGLVDIQSHSLTHALVPVSGRLRGFVHPGFNAGAFGNVDLPISSLDAPSRPERCLRFGAPVLEAASRLAARPRFREDEELVRALVRHVEERGNEAFFARPFWRRELTSVFERWPPERRGSFETEGDMRAAIRRELVESKALLERRLAGRTVRHFCYPWFAGSELADRMAAEAGYRTVHGGIDVAQRHPPDLPVRIQRISEEYLFRLPGDGRGRVAPIWLHRARGFLVKRARAVR